MTTGTTSTLTYRVEPGLKKALRPAAERQHRSVADMVEVLFRPYCRRDGIDFSETRSLKAKG